MNKKYVVGLTEDERVELEGMPEEEPQPDRLRVWTQDHWPAHSTVDETVGGLKGERDFHL